MPSSEALLQAACGLFGVARQCCSATAFGSSLACVGSASSGINQLDDTPGVLTAGDVRCRHHPAMRRSCERVRRPAPAYPDIWNAQMTVLPDNNVPQIAMKVRMGRMPRQNTVRRSDPPIC